MLRVVVRDESLSAEGEEERRLSEQISTLSTAGEAPLQIVFTLWLMIREILKPPDIGQIMYITYEYISIKQQRIDYI